MFADVFTLRLGETVVKGRRLTLAEIRENTTDFIGGSMDVDACVKLVADHVTLEDGSPFDPLQLSPGQLRQLIGEMVLPQEGRGISDFIGLLS